MNIWGWLGLALIFVLLMLVGKQKKEIEALVEGADAKNRRIDGLLKSITETQKSLARIDVIANELLSRPELPLIPVPPDIQPVINNFGDSMVEIMERLDALPELTELADGPPLTNIELVEEGIYGAREEIKRELNNIRAIKFKAVKNDETK